MKQPTMTEQWAFSVPASPRTLPPINTGRASSAPASPRHRQTPTWSETATPSTSRGASRGPSPVPPSMTIGRGPLHLLKDEKPMLRPATTEARSRPTQQKPRSLRPATAPASPTATTNHLRKATTPSLASEAAPVRPMTAWAATGNKRPAQTWAARDAQHYEKYTAAEKHAGSWQQPPALVRVPSKTESSCDESYVNGAAADVDATRRHRLNAGRWHLPNKENEVTPGILALLQQLHEPEPEELTDGGVSLSKMQAALAVLPPSHALARQEPSAARAMEDALEGAAHARDYHPRARRTSVGAHLDRLEFGYRRELVGNNEVQRLIKVLRRHREKLQAKFDEWDTNHDGEITKPELLAVLSSLGLKARPEEIDAFFDEFDPDGSGALDMKEFYGVAFATRRYKADNYV